MEDWPPNDDVNMRCGFCSRSVTEGEFVWGAKIIPTATFGNPNAYSLGLRDKFHPDCLEVDPTHEYVPDDQAA